VRHPRQRRRVDGEALGQRVLELGTRGHHRVDLACVEERPRGVERPRAAHVGDELPAHQPGEVEVGDRVVLHRHRPREERPRQRPVVGEVRDPVGDRQPLVGVLAGERSELVADLELTVVGHAHHHVDDAAAHVVAAPDIVAQVAVDVLVSGELLEARLDAEASAISRPISTSTPFSSPASM
jgi:hypothetical protein